MFVAVAPKEVVVKPSLFRPKTALSAAILGLTVACTGTVADRSAGNDGRGGDDGGDADGGGAGTSSTPPGACRVVAPLRRLTDVQYRNTVRDLFKGKVTSGKDFPATEIGSSRSGFSTEPVANVVTALGSELMLSAAEDAALSVADNLPMLLPCAASSPNEACAKTFIDEYGRRAFRRPLGDDEKAFLLGFYKQATGADAFKDGIALIVTGILQTPEFLYQIEGSANGNATQLTSHQVAARLSYLLWDSMPDDTLAAAADKDELSSSSAIRSQAERMLQDGRASPTITRFVREWTHIHTFAAGEKSSPVYTAALATAMQTELEKFSADAFLSETGSINGLLTSRTTFANKTLAQFYGAPVGARKEAEFTKLDVDDHRSGLLTLPAFLSGLSHANETSYVLRGVFVRKKLLCDALPPPPANAQAMVPPTPAGASQRTKSELIRQIDRCAACHNLIDSVGLTFESYDELGNYRTKLASGAAIDTSGELLDAPDGLQGKFSSVPELARKLAASDDVGRCVATQWFRFAQGREEDDADACAIDELATSLKNSDGNLRSMLLALVGSESFRFRATGAK